MDLQQSELEQIKRSLEAALLSSSEPVPITDLRKLFDAEYGAGIIRRVLDELKADWVGRGVELVSVASGWRFQVCQELQSQLDRLNPLKPPKYSRAVLETLAIIAYKQPVTRGDIENIRGVGVSANILRVLEARGWIDVVGHKESPGRPALFSTTRSFLDDLNLRSLDELPSLDELGTLVEDADGISEDLAGNGDAPVTEAEAGPADFSGTDTEVVEGQKSDDEKQGEVQAYT